MSRRNIMICLIILILAISAGAFWLLWEKQGSMQEPGGTLVNIWENRGSAI